MKRILSLLLLTTLLFSACLLTVSCGGGDDTGNGCTSHTDSDGDGYCDNDGCDEKVEGENPPPQVGEDYTVTVVDINGAPVANVSLKFTYGKQETAVCTTDTNGKATAKIDTLSDVIVEFVNLEGYGAPRKADRNFDGETEKTVELLPLISVRAVDENGNALAGVKIVLCHTSCLAEKTTDENGEITVAFKPESTIKIAIKGVPDGYAVPEVLGEVMGVAYHQLFEDGSFSATVVITPLPIE